MADDDTLPARVSAEDALRLAHANYRLELLAKDAELVQLRQGMAAMMLDKVKTEMWPRYGMRDSDGVELPSGDITRAE